MAIVPERKNAIVLARNFRDSMTARTGITDFGQDSKTDVLISVFLDEIVGSRNETINAIYSNQISNARGENLDAIGRDMSLPRENETFAVVRADHNNFAFYSSSGTFGSLNGGADIFLPAGKRLFSAPNDNELGAEVSYTLTSDTILPASGTVHYVSAQCAASGTIGNVGHSTIVNHDFTDYTAGTGLGVINFYPVLNGRPRELDRNYRFRLSRRYEALAASNYSKIHLQALRVPGVIDTRVISGYYGIGSVAVVVIGAENLSTPALVRAVQYRLNVLKGPGIEVTAVGATSVLFDLEMRVSTLRTLTSVEKAQVESNLRRGLRNYFRTQGIASSVSLVDAAREAQAQIPGVAQILSVSNTSDVFQNAWIRKGESSGTTTERDLLINRTYSLDEDEYADLGTFSVEFV